MKFIKEKTMIVLANCNPIHKDRLRVLQKDIGALYISTPQELEALTGRGTAPKIFFFHWSWIIPERIYNTMECILFHMTDLPYGRGGSPLQNLIVAGHEKTMVSAIQVAKGLDTGPVYLKSPLSLQGTAREIFLRAGRKMVEMTLLIIREQPEPVPQEGDPTVFKRRKPEDGNIGQLTELDKIYDYIRMLDADGYPPAFIETEHFRIEFSRASLHTEKITADVSIVPK
jgi:methionyl-tRNA formyltransferase